MAMDVGILQALKAVKNNPYVQYVGIGLAGLVADKEHRDQQTGAPQRKSKLELMRISAAVCGIELCYAAETAFVSPILLKLGVPASLMTLTWCLSPVLGFFLVPVMGSLSDRCRLRIGRRRPFIIIMSIGIVLGLGLVPNGEALGTLLGDQGNETVRSASGPGYTPPQMNETGASQKSSRDSFLIPSEHFWGIMFTILGVAMLDFSCDACQSPCRAYLLDVSVAEDHSAGLTTFTVMAGAGGSIGYIMGGIDWNSTHFGEILGGHIRVVFSVVLVSFIICIFFTLTSFRETPLSELGSVDPEIRKERSFKYTRFTDEDFSVEENIQEQPRISERRYKETSETANSNFQPTQDSTFHSQAKQSKTDIKTSEPEKCSGLIGIPGNELSPILTTQIEKLTKSQRTMPGFYQSTTKQSSQIPMSNSSNCCDENQMLKDEEKASKECIDALFHGTTKENEEINLYAINCTHKEHNDVLAISDVDAMGKVEISADVTLKTYLKSIIQMPRCMWVLCLCNLLCWMSLVCYSLYFTDFVGRSVWHALVVQDIVVCVCVLSKADVAV